MRPVETNDAQKRKSQALPLGLTSDRLLIGSQLHFRYGMALSDGEAGAEKCSRRTYRSWQREAALRCQDLISARSTRGRPTGSCRGISHFSHFSRPCLSDSPSRRCGGPLPNSHLSETNAFSDAGALRNRRKRSKLTRIVFRCVRPGALMAHGADHLDHVIIQGAPDAMRRQARMTQHAEGQAANLLLLGQPRAAKEVRRVCSPADAEQMPIACGGCCWHLGRVHIVLHFYCHACLAAPN